jgi:selenium metabolism protein YedF
MAQSLGRTVQVKETAASEFELLVSAAAGGSSQAPAAGTSASQAPAPDTCAGATRGARNVVLVSSAEFGHGERELGELLMRTFIYTLKEVEPAPHALLFVNGGVHLTTEGSALLEDIQALADRGVQVFSCGTCLDYYKLKEKLKVGAMTNMFSIVSMLSTADRVIRP